MQKTLARRGLAALLTLALMLSLVPAVLAADPPAQPDPADYTLSPDTVKLIAGKELGETIKLNVKAGATTPTNVTWRSSVESVATVKGTGDTAVVTPVSAGRTTIIASFTIDGVEITPACDVIVEAASIETIKVTLDKTTDQMDFGETIWLKIEEVDATLDNGKPLIPNLTDKTNLTWSAESSDPAIEVPPFGRGTKSPIRVYAKGVPKTSKVTITITVSYDGVSSDPKEGGICEITVNSKTRVIITEYNAAVETVNATVGTNKFLQALVTVDEDVQENTVISWSSSSPSVVTCTSDGKNGVTLEPKSKGEATITATYTKDGVTSSAKVKCIVSPAPSTDPDDPDNPDGNEPGDELPEGVSVSKVTIGPPSSPHTMNVGTENINASVEFTKTGSTTPTKAEVEWKRDGGATATYRDGKNTYTIPVTWSSSDKNVASVSSGRLRADMAGTATITAKAGNTEGKLEVTVSGFRLVKDSVTLTENERYDPVENGVIEKFGTANPNSLIYQSDNSYVASPVEGKIVGSAPGTATITVSGANGSFRGTFKVTVKPDPNATIEAGTVRMPGTLKFSSLLSDFKKQAGGNLNYITGLNVDPQCGTLYYSYKSEAEPGTGVGAGNYFLNPVSGQRGISDITFVPSSSFAGGEVLINYTAVSTLKENYNCHIKLTVEPEGGTSSGGIRPITVTTKYNTPVRFSSTEFNKVCRDKTGVNLSYVTFSQPPERQGTLYTNYAGEGNFGSMVNLRTQYSLKELDDIWFVPAPGFTGTVTVYYTARSTGYAGDTYTGQVDILVGKDSSGAVLGGLSYEIARGGVARFNDEDFNNYCRDVLYEDSWYDRQTLAYIRFDALPDASQGVLYYDYRSSSNTGSAAALGTSYYYGTRSPRIDYLTFVPVENYIGTVKIPFTGWTTDGTRFTGNVEVNVRGGVSVGDIRYTCAPGKTARFDDSHFNRLCRELTGKSLNYIVLRSLPSSNDGTIYHNSSQASTGTRYYNGSGASKIDNLSFRASKNFAGAVDIPFMGYATGGESFTGIITIESSTSGSSSGSAGNIRYTTDSKNAAVFHRDDFDDLSQWETDRDVSSVRFEVPSSSQGTLYRNYRSSSSLGTKITSSTSITAGDLSRVAFLPAGGYTGTVYLDFTATAAGNGGTFKGTVEIEVERASADVTVRYTTRTAPVKFYSGDFTQKNYSLSSIRFSSLPSISVGCLYSQYTSPIRYGRQAGTNTSYQVSGSNLISDLSFVPRAGYTGTVSLPYVGTNSNGSTFEGEVLITVSPSYSSAYFNDMGGYTDAQRAAVDFLRENGITNGISSTQYGPEHSITRGDFAVMIYQAFGLTASGSANAFYDVPSGVYYAQAVNTLRALGIVSGVGNGAYAPQDTLSRQDGVCMVQRAMRAAGWNANDGYVGVLSTYSDRDSVAGYAQGAVANAVQVGWLPTRSGRLDPRDPLTRVDMAEMIHRVLTY